MNNQIILAIESSCDDTSAAILKNGILLSNIVATQAVHQQYGGVVPELASRAHMQNIVPTVDLAFKTAKVKKEDLTAVAFTQAPGLIGSLMVGAAFAKGMAQALNIPLIAVHHMQAHILAHFIENPKPEFPFLCLTVSGGHTQLVLCHDYLKIEIVGTTIDDAAGEAFDKIAKMLNLPYPGGPFIDKYAQMGDPSKFKFPISDIKELDFSFSGIKTSVLYFLQKELKENPKFIAENLNDICASVQFTIVKTLIQRLEKAAKFYQVKNIGIAGGVSANSELRKALKETGENNQWETFCPKFEYCTDNAAMIGITAHYKLLKLQFSDLKTVPSARAEWDHGE